MTGGIMAGAKPQAPCGDAPHAASFSAQVDRQGLWVVVGMCGAHSGHSLHGRQGRRWRTAQTCRCEAAPTDRRCFSLAAWQASRCRTSSKCSGCSRRVASGQEGGQ